MLVTSVAVGMGWRGNSTDGCKVLVVSVLCSAVLAQMHKCQCTTGRVDCNPLPKHAGVEAETLGMDGHDKSRNQALEGSIASLCNNP